MGPNRFVPFDNFFVIVPTIRHDDSSEGNQDTDLKFLLGETHEKAKQSERAQAVYQTIVDSGDPFWARLAKERLRGISIQTKLNIEETAIKDELRSL